VSEADADLVRAAGAILVRDGKVALVHRPQYDDWTLPKGKLEPGESEPDAAVREVEEETGFIGEIVADLGTIEYTVVKGGRELPKQVRYYLMTTSDGGFTGEFEVDELRWLDRGAADALLTYERDREVLARWPG
jgi:8-oxo-dGTP diphosphatase